MYTIDISLSIPKTIRRFSTVRNATTCFHNFVCEWMNAFLLFCKVQCIKWPRIIKYNLWIMIILSYLKRLWLIWVDHLVNNWNEMHGLMTEPKCIHINNLFIKWQGQIIYNCTVLYKSYINSCSIVSTWPIGLIDHNI